MRPSFIAVLLIFVQLPINCSDAIDFKLAIVVEQDAVNISLIDLTVRRRVNSNWRLLSGHSMSHFTVQVPLDGAQLAARLVCSQFGLSGLLAIGNCGLISELSSLARSLQLPFIALPTALCDSSAPIFYEAVGSHSTDEILGAVVEAIRSKKPHQVALIYDLNYGGQVLQDMQTRLSDIGISSVTLNVDSASRSSLSADLSDQLSRLMKKRIFNAVVMATPRNAVSIAAAAVAASVMQQNYFWLVIDSGLSKSQLMPVCPSNCNLALLRGGTQGVNQPSDCPTAVRDVFQSCDTGSIRTLDVRLVDAIEALAKALTDSLTHPRFQPSNASCFPLQPWTSGADVLNNVLSLNNYDTGRGVISYNSSTRFFNAQGVEIVASLTEQLGGSTRFVLSGRVIGGSLTKEFRKRGATFVFPNTFTDFNNATIVACAPPSYPSASILERRGNGSYLGYGYTPDAMHYLAEKMNFQFVLKAPDDGEWGRAAPNAQYFTGCVGELQRGTVHLAAGPFTKTTSRDSVIDFSADLFDEYIGILVPKLSQGTNMWNVFLPLHWHVWLCLGCCFFVAAFSVWVLAYFSPFSAINLGLDGALNDEASYMEYMWTIIGSFLQQGQDFYPCATSPRISLAFWWFFNVIFYAAYTAFLTSILTVTVVDLPIKTLQDLVAQSAIIPGSEPGTSGNTLLRQATSGIYKEVADKMVDDSDCSEKSFRSNIACIDDMSFLRYKARANCTKVYIADEHFFAATVAFMYPEDAYYAELMDFYIQKFRETGQMQMVLNQYDGSNNITQCQTGVSSSEAEPIRLETVAGCFAVTGCFYALGLLQLFLELVVARVQGHCSAT